MRRLIVRMAGVCGLLMASSLALVGCGPREPVSEGAPADMRRLTEEQYRNTIADLFGPTVTYGGHFDPLTRIEGLTALGARIAQVTPSGFEQYYASARSIAAQVVNETNRQVLVPCTPASPNSADDKCAKQFFTKVGRLLYRRPLTAAEIDVATTLAHDVAERRSDFYQGLAFSLAGMMATPNFLFVVDSTEPDPNSPGNVRLTPFARASRLSFLLWNSTPDDVLLNAAERGDLYTKSGLDAQIERMVGSPNLEAGVRAFFTDFLNLEKLETLEKDPIIYPAFGARTTEDSREQLLRTITDHLVARNLDYRDLFTTGRTFVTATLARIYKLPVDRPDGGWAPYQFASDDPRAGIMAQIAFLAVNSHPGRSSPTLRGRAIREVLLCQKVPDPPGDVDFSLFNDPNSPSKTARQRLTVHATAPACAGCHKITDPIGLGLESFDGAGAIRATESGETIDVSGELDGKPFKDAAGLAKVMRDNPAVPACLVNRLYAYAVGRPAGRAEKETVAYFEKLFAADGYRVPELLRRIAASDAFYKVSPARAGTSAQSGSTVGYAQKDNPS